MRDREKRKNRRSTLTHFISYELTCSVPLNTSKYSFSLICSLILSMWKTYRLNGVSGEESRGHHVAVERQLGVCLALQPPIRKMYKHMPTLYELRGIKNQSKGREVVKETVQYFGK